MEHAELILVELVFASEQTQQILSVEVVKGTSAREAMTSSELVQEFPDMDFTQCALGIWGRIVHDEQSLRQGDRVEAYRPLRRDPRDARRELALAGRSMGGSSS